VAVKAKAGLSGAILQIGTFTEEQLTELQTALVAGHLESIYTLA